MRINQRFLDIDFSNFGSLKSTETVARRVLRARLALFSNFGSLKSTETRIDYRVRLDVCRFSNFGSLKSTETTQRGALRRVADVSAISAR